MYKVLLVDDEYLPKMALRNLLDWESYNCTLAGTASNGAEALDWHKQHTADIIITDLKMPVMDGIELVRSLAGQNFDGAVLVLSNYADFELVREALVAGALNYMLKINLSAEEVGEQLRRTVEHIEKQRRTQLEDENRSSMAQKYSARMRTEALRDYFLYAAAPLPALQEDYAGRAFRLCILSVQNCSIQEKSRQKVCGHIADILREAFEEADIFDCFVDEKNVVFLVPQAVLETKNQRIEDRLEFSARQISTYLDLPHTNMVLAPAESTLLRLKQQFEACVAACALCFYTACPQLIHAGRMRFSALPPDAEMDRFAQEAARLFLLGKTAEAGTLVDSLMDGFYQKMVHPDDVCRAFRTAAVQLAPNLGNALRSDELEKAVVALRTAKNQAALKELFMQTVPLLLAPGAAADVPGHKKGVPEVLSYVQQHYTEKITLDELAAVFFLEKSYLCRLFKKETGTSLFRHINNLRMQRAAELFAGGAVYVKEVAAAVGLPDSFYFTRLFTKYHGLSPSAYRRARVAAPLQDDDGYT